MNSDALRAELLSTNWPQWDLSDASVPAGNLLDASSLAPLILETLPTSPEPALPDGRLVLESGLRILETPSEY